jgi:uncharacterized glyoxalase superfamily protein PhnB
MKHHHIPEGFQTISPFFCVEHAKGFIDFLQRAFKAEQLYIKELENGLVKHALVKIGNSFIEIADARNGISSNAFSFQLFVENCDEVFATAIKEGADAIETPSDKIYGVRAGYVQDSWGNQWFISTQIKNRYSPAFWKSLEEQYQ